MKLLSKWLIGLFACFILLDTPSLHACCHRHKFNMLQFITARFDLQEAIDSASSGDTIRIPAGTHMGPFTINKSLTLIGETEQVNGEETILTILDGGGRFRVLKINGVLGTRVVLRNLIIQNGNASDAGGGGILNIFARLKLSNVRVINNMSVVDFIELRGGGGGGIFNHRGSFTIENSEISNNRVRVIEDTFNSIMRRLIKNNNGRRQILGLLDVGRGGGILTDSGQNIIINSKILHNFTEDSGGGLSNEGRGQIMITNCEINDNQAVNGAGGIFNSGILTLKDCELQKNETSSRGGGIFNSRNGTLTLNHCRLINNGSVPSGGDSARGGGVFNQGNLTLVNGCLLKNNKATSLGPALGGGIFNNGFLNLKDSIVKKNKAFSDEGRAEGGGIYNTNESTFIIDDKNNVRNNTPDNIFNEPDDEPDLNFK